MEKKGRKYFIALTGAKKNVGDFLITKRAIALLKHVSPEHDFLIYPHWKELEDLDLVNKSEGIIILGGPGFQMRMYPGVYKLTKNLDDIKVPVYTLGTGWKGIPGDRTTERLYHFSKTSKTLLDRINSTYAGISCRDYQTERVLKNNGYKNVTMTGCPVWYDLNSIGKEFKVPKEIKKIVYTPAQNELLSEQSIEVLRFLISKYRNAEIIASFHRGLGELDQYTTESDAENTKKIADAALKLGVKVIDVSGDSDKLKFYDEYDLHVGYRVHAHIYFLSKRLPSILLHEDGRGNGVSEALKSPGINAYKISSLSLLFNLFKQNYFIAKAYSRIGTGINDKIVDDLKEEISKIEMTNYECYKKTTNIIDEHFIIMKKFINSMIYNENNKL